LTFTIKDVEGYDELSVVASGKLVKVVNDYFNFDAYKEFFFFAI